MNNEIEIPSYDQKEILVSLLFQMRLATQEHCLPQDMREAIRAVMIPALERARQDPTYLNIIRLDVALDLLGTPLKQVESDDPHEKAIHAFRVEQRKLYRQYKHLFHLDLRA